MENLRRHAMSKTQQSDVAESSGRTLDTVLVAVGQEDRERVTRLAREAIAVAGPADATVVVAHVFTEEEYPQVLDTLGMDGGVDDVTASEVAERHSATRELVSLLGDAGVEYEVRGTVGGYADGIVSIAEDVEADRVIVGGRRRSPAGKAVFGSTAQEVMLSSPSPVTFVRGDTA